MLNSIKAVCLRWAAPLLEATPKQRIRWLLCTLVFSMLAVGAEVWFYDNYRIAWDRQILRCLDARFLLVDLKDQEIEREILRDALEHLGAREKRIIMLRFGLGGQRERTQKEVADAIGISQSYISRLEKRIIRQLREQLGE